MRFSVIYSVDMPHDVSVRVWAPPGRRAWQQTEGDEQYDLDIWDKGKHRKWCGLLTRKQFDAFVDKVGFKMEDVETMGSIGAPACGFGCAPAFSFHDNSYGDRGYADAYVTPLPDVEPRDDEAWQDRAWERIRRAMLSVYG